MDLKGNIRKWIIQLNQDPIASILRENSKLTKIQLETLIIDILGPQLCSKELTMKEKANLRVLSPGVSRGSYNRTLRQARRNAIQSIYTILLLGYLGVIEDIRLTPYIDVANELNAYVNAYKELWKNNRQNDENSRIVRMLRKQLKERLEKLSGPSEI